MERYMQYEVFAPEYFRTKLAYPNQAYPNRFTATALRVPIFVKNNELVFDAKYQDDAPVGAVNEKLIAVYAAMAALAIHLGWISDAPPKVALPKYEPLGVLDGKQVAQMVDFEAKTTRYVRLNKEQIELVCQRHLALDNGDVWSKIIQAEVTQLEDYVVLEAHEKAELLRKANKYIQDAEVTFGDQFEYIYRFTSEEILKFAPNALWGFWAIKKSRDNDPGWRCTRYNVNYKRGTCDIVWKRAIAATGRAYGY